MIRAPVLVGTLFSIVLLVAPTSAHAQAPPLDRIVAVAENFAGLRGEPGCGAISIFDSHVAEAPIFRGPDLGRSLEHLSANRDFSVLVAGTGSGNRSDFQRLRRDPEGDVWRADRVKTLYNFFESYAAVLVLDDPLRLNTTAVRGGSGVSDVTQFLLPAGEDEYIEREAMPIGLPVPDIVPELMLSPEGIVSVAWTRSGSVYEYRVSDMSQVRAPIAVPTVVVENATKIGTGAFMRSNLSPGGRYLVMNQADSPSLVAIDRVTSELTTVDVSDWITMTGGIAFNAGWQNNGLLAVHGAGRIIVFRFDPSGAFELLSSAEVEAPSWNNLKPFGGPIEWSGDGSRPHRRDQRRSE